MICIQDSRIKSLEQELELFEWEFSRMKEISFNGSSKCTNGIVDCNNVSVANINDKSCDLLSLSHLSTRKSVTDAEKEVCFTAPTIQLFMSIDIRSYLQIVALFSYQIFSATLKSLKIESLEIQALKSQIF